MRDHLWPRRKGHRGWFDLVRWPLLGAGVNVQITLLTATTTFVSFEQKTTKTLSSFCIAWVAVHLLQNFGVFLLPNICESPIWKIKMHVVLLGCWTAPGLWEEGFTSSSQLEGPLKKDLDLCQSAFHDQMAYLGKLNDANRPLEDEACAHLW